MPVPRHILVLAAPVPGGAEAVSCAARLARPLGAELILLGVEQPITADEVDRAWTAPELVDALTNELLADVVALVPPDVRARTVLGWGAPGPATIAAAHDHAVDLVVVPMRRGSPVGHLLHDHADRQILHRCPVPVLVVPVFSDHARTPPASEAGTPQVAA